MRTIVRLVACVGIALTAAGCNPVTERRYITEGAGVDLYTADREQQIELQKQYIDFVCQQAGAACAAGNWPVFVQAGMNDIDLRCDGFLTWLDARRRDKEPVLNEISAISTATHSIMMIAGASEKSLGIAVAAFGLATDTYTNWNSRLLLAINQSTVQEVVYTSQGKFRDKIKTFPINDQPTAIYLLRNYLRLCMPTTIEAAVNTSATLVQRDAPAAASQSTVLRSVTSNPRQGVIIRANIGTDDARKILTQYVYPNGVLKPRDKAHEQDVADFMKEKNIKGHVGFFLDSGNFAAERSELLSRLKASGKIL
jgi:hypothetical protein